MYEFALFEQHRLNENMVEKNTLLCILEIIYCKVFFRSPAFLHN